MCESIVQNTWFLDTSPKSCGFVFFSNNWFGREDLDQHIGASFKESTGDGGTGIIIGDTSKLALSVHVADGAMAEAFCVERRSPHVDTNSFTIHNDCLREGSNY